MYKSPYSSYVIGLDVDVGRGDDEAWHLFKLWLKLPDWSWGSQRSVQNSTYLSNVSTSLPLHS